MFGITQVPSRSLLQLNKGEYVDRGDPTVLIFNNMIYAVGLMLFLLSFLGSYYACK